MITKSVVTVTRTTLTVEKEQLRVALCLFLSIAIPPDAEFSVTVPGGGDWSNTSLTLGDDCKHLIVSWTDTTKETT